MLFNHLRYDLFDTLGYADVSGLAGMQLTLSNPPNADFQLVHLQTQLDTDANVADRTVFLNILYHSISMVMAVSPVIQTASKTWYYLFQLGINSYTPAIGNRVFVPLPDRMRINESFLITLSCANMQVGDQFTATRSVRNLWQTV